MASNGAGFGAANGSAKGAALAAAPSPSGEPRGHGAARASGRASGNGAPGHGASGHGALARATGRGGAHGAENGADAIDPAFIVARLEEAGRTLLALPQRGYSPGLRMNRLDIVQEAVEAYGWSEGRIRLPVPPAQRITRMDESFAWLRLIPEDRYVLRRIVGARALVSPYTDRHLYPWRRLATLLGADHKAVQRWHAQGVGLIVQGLGG